MRLYIVRHAEAVMLDEKATIKDADRPLTPKGLEDARKVAQHLKYVGLEKPKIISSPLLRSRQTAEVFQRTWTQPLKALQFDDRLKPGVDWKPLLESLPAGRWENAWLIGHQPELGQIIGWLLGRKSAKIRLNKGSVACLDIKEKATKGTGRLRWLLDPELLL
ncbi:histidine phosphatase family protein [Telmatocola sphagniphila]|uniref:Histidine phosphatase family protein n=1 Tax=Telmatocola sphagniphila TaxID=1123043 RepID=A0A8E6B964_9BACT|nr:histidine phosphatase family protein [Telmatocola sphagniphila]QVL32853.1 histidine phosphatase family protein [Telmatocola sphagniphila]